MATDSVLLFTASAPAVSGQVVRRRRPILRLRALEYSRSDTRHCLWPVGRDEHAQCASQLARELALERDPGRVEVWVAGGDEL